METTRARMVEARTGRREPRPFAGRGGYAVRSEPTCPECLEIGATPEESFDLHHEPDLLALLAPGEAAEMERAYSTATGEIVR